MNKSYISPKTGKPYYGAAAQAHFIYTVNGGPEKYNDKIGKEYLADALCTLAWGIYLSGPIVSVIKIVILKAKQPSS